MPSGADQLASELASIRRRLSNLETAPRAPHTSVAGGQTRWFLDDGSELPVLYLGQGGSDLGIWLETIGGVGSVTEIFLGTINGVPQLSATNTDMSAPALRVHGGRLAVPLISCAWQFDPARGMDAQGRAEISSGAYTRGWTSILPIGTGDIRSSVIVQLGAGVTEAAARIRARPYPSGGAVQTVYEETGITGPTFLGGLPWTIPDSILSPAASPVGTLVLLEVEARVTGGAGNVLVAPDAPVVNSFVA